PEHPVLPELRHREEPDLPAGALAEPEHDQRVEQRDMIDREQHRAAARDAFGSDPPDVEREAQRVADDAPEPVDPLDAVRASTWQLRRRVLDPLVEVADGRRLE